MVAELPGSVDTGARERLTGFVEWLSDRQAEALADLDRFPNGAVALSQQTMTVLLDDLRAALAAGVGVPPPEDLVSAAKNAARAKISDALGALHVLQSRADRILNGHDDPNEMAQDIRALRREAHEHLVAASHALAGVGEARPAEPPPQDQVSALGSQRDDGA